MLQIAADSCEVADRLQMATDGHKQNSSKRHPRFPAYNTQTVYQKSIEKFFPIQALHDPKIMRGALHEVVVAHNIWMAIQLGHALGVRDWKLSLPLALSPFVIRTMALGLHKTTMLEKMYHIRKQEQGLGVMLIKMRSWISRCI